MAVKFCYDDVALVALGASVTFMTNEDTLVTPRANLIHPDRKTRARVLDATSTTVDIEINLGVSRDITGFGILYVLSDGAFPAMELFSSTSSSYASVTSRATKAASYWKTGTSLVEPIRDWVDVIASASAQYWRLRCTTATARFSLGKIMLGTGKDFGRIYTKGSGYKVVNPVTRDQAADHSVVDMPEGEPYRAYDYKYFATTDADVVVFERLARQTVPWGLLDSRGYSSHVVNEDPNEMGFEHEFDTLWNVQVSARQMP